MTRKSYKKYKDSGIEWLGKIPEHWDILKLKHGFQYIGSGTTPKSNKFEYYEGNIAWVTTSELREILINDTINKLSEKALRDYPTLKLYPINTLLFAIYGATIGRLGILGIPATVNQACVAFSSPVTLDTKFVYYWLWVRRPILIALSKGGGQPNLNQDELKQLKVPAPSLDEQKSISDFLDKETSRIDSLIQKKEKQIKLLKEKRLVLITQAVTKGLNPNVKMKDSGVEYLGKIPEYWEIKKLRYVGQCQNGISKKAEYFGTGFPFLGYSEVYNFLSLPLTVGALIESTEQERKHYSVMEGDVFFTRTSETIEDIGFTSTCLKTIKNAVFSGFLIRFRPKKFLFKGFSKYYFRSNLHRRFFVKEMNLVTRASLSQELLKRLPILLPPLQDQKEIANFLDKETSQIDSLMKKLRKSIELLKEYRSALITSAVTGQIDVRESQTKNIN